MWLFLGKLQNSQLHDAGAGVVKCAQSSRLPCPDLWLELTPPGCGNLSGAAALVYTFVNQERAFVPQTLFLAFRKEAQGIPDKTSARFSRG